MMYRIPPRAVALALALAITAIPALAPVQAQTSAAEILEQARSKARDMEELRKILNGPDQNMRLATFDAMMTSGDEALQQIALDAGLASADALMQAMAFKAAIMSLDRLVLTLEVDGTQPEPIQEAARSYLEKNGNSWVLSMPKKEPDNGTFRANVNSRGEVSGTMLNFDYGRNSGTLALKDDATVGGPVTLYHNGGNAGFVGTGRIR